MPKAADPVASLVAQLAAEGELESQGQFTLDRERARDKLQRFQLADPARYVLLLVEAAVAQGASDIQIEIDSNDVVFTFDGAPFDEAALEALWDVLLGDPLPAFPGLRPLALGLNAAMGRRPGKVHVSVRSGPKDGGTQLSLREGAAPEIGMHSNEQGLTRVHVREGLGMHSVSQFFRNVQSERDEELLLRKHCAFVDTPITVNGARFSTGLPVRIGCASQLVTHKGAHLVAGLAPLLGAQPQLQRCRRGVQIDHISPQHYPPQVLAFVDDPNFALDLSHAGIRRDAHHDEVMARLDKLVFKMLAETCAEGQKLNGLVPGLSHWSISAFESLYLSALEHAFHLGEMQGHPCAQPLFALPFFVTLTGKSVSLLDIAERVERKGWIGVATQQPSEALTQQDRSTIFVRSKREREVLRKALPAKTRSRDKVLTRTDNRAKNKRRWEAQRRDPRLGPALWRATLAIDAGSIQGEMGLGHGGARMDLIFNGGLIQSFDPKLDVPGLVIVLEGPFTPRKTFDAVHCDQALERAIAAVLSHLPSLLQSVRIEEHDGGYRAACRDLIRAVQLRDYGRELYVAAGYSRNGTKRRLRGGTYKRSCPSLDLGAIPDDSDRVSPALKLPILRELSGTFASLWDLEQRRREGGEIYWLPLRERVPVAHELLPPILHLDKEQHAIVEKVFGSWPIKSGTPLVTRAVALELFRKMPATQARSDERPDRLYGLLLPVLQTKRKAKVELWLAVKPNTLVNFWSHDDAARHLARITIFCEGRQVGRAIEVPAPLPGMLGVAQVGLDALNVPLTALVKSAQAAVEKLTANYPREAISSPVEQTQLTLDSGAGQGLLRALLELGVLRRKDGAEVSKKQVCASLAKAPWPALLPLCKVEDAQGANRTFAELVVMARANGRLCTTTRTDFSQYALPEEAPLLVQDSTKLGFLTRLCGVPAEDITKTLEQRNLAEKLRSHRDARPAQLSVPCVFETRVELELDGKGFEAHVGLPATLPSVQVARIELSRDGRLVETHHTNQLPPIVAAIEGPFELQSVDHVRRDQVFEQVFVRLQAALGCLVPYLLDAPAKTTAHAREHAEAWLSALLFAEPPISLSSSTRSRLRTLPLLELADGPRGDQVLRVSAQALEVRFPDQAIPTYDRSHDARLLPPTGTLLLARSQVDQVGASFGLQLRDRSQDWVDHLQWLASLSSRRTDPRARKPDHALVTFSRVIEGHPCTLWIDDREENAALLFCGADRVVAVHELFAPLHVSGLVELNPQSLQWSAQPPALDDLRLELSLACLDLFHSLLEQGSQDDADPRLKARLRRAHARLVDTKDVDLLRLREAIEDAPLRRMNGKWLSLAEVARVERFDAQARRVAAQRQSHAAQGEASTSAAAHLNQGQAFDVEADLGLHVEHRIGADIGADIEEDSEAASAASSLARAIVANPQLILLEHLRAEIRASRAGAGNAYNDAQLDQVQARAASGARAIDIDASGVFLDTAHFMVRESLSQVREGAVDPQAPAGTRASPVLVSILASALASALNFKLTAIRETHELSLCLHMVRRAAKRD